MAITLREAYIAAAVSLGGDAALRDHAAFDARILLLHALRLPATALHTQPERALTAGEAADFDALLGRRRRMEPIQYILGEQEFYGLPFRVTPATLIPRPETELLVEAVLARLPMDGAIDIVDVGTGSGAIAVALAHHLRQAHVLAVDVSEAALAIAHENAARNGVTGRVDFLRSDLLTAVPANVRFNAIVSNPPYIPTSERLTLHPQVRDYEPAAALFAGYDGLDVYRRLIPEARQALKAGGLLALEFGYGQASAVRSLLGGWGDVEIVNDLQDIPRVALARVPRR